MIFLNCLTSDQTFPPLSPNLADHPLMNSLLNSLLLDGSSTVSTIGLTVLAKLLPMFAVHSYEELKKMLPHLFVVLAKVMCWKERVLPVDLPPDEVEEVADAAEKVTEDFVERLPLELRPDLGWQRLELTFRATSSAPSSDTYFSLLYYLFPCNLLRFLRAPCAYLHDRGFETPYTVNWEDALDEANIRSKAEVRCVVYRYDYGTNARQQRLCCDLTWSMLGSSAEIGRAS